MTVSAVASPNVQATQSVPTHCSSCKKKFTLATENAPYRFPCAHNACFFCARTLKACHICHLPFGLSQCSPAIAILDSLQQSKSPRSEAAAKLQPEDVDAQTNLKRVLELNSAESYRRLSIAPVHSWIIRPYQTGLSNYVGLAYDYKVGSLSVKTFVITCRLDQNPKVLNFPLSTIQLRIVLNDFEIPDETNAAIWLGKHLIEKGHFDQIRKVIDPQHL